jgi:hypothetical protein
MRVLFILLLLGNLVFFGLKQGWFGPMLPQSAEPQRLQNQVSPEIVKVLTEPEMTAASKAYASKTQPLPLPVSQPTAAPSCLEWGSFSSADGQKAASLLAPLGLGAKLTRSTREETATHMVLMGPYVERPEAERKAAEVRRLGVTDVAVIENVQGRFVSLGVFTSRQGAQTRLEQARTKGVNSARVSERETTLTRELFQVRDVDTVLEGKLRALSAQLGGAAWVACST